MHTRTVSIALDGPVSLDKLTRALDAWTEALENAAKIAGSNHLLGLKVDSLSGGSANVSVEATFNDANAADVFATNVGNFGLKVRDDAILELPDILRKPARDLRRIIQNDGGYPIVLSSADDEVMVVPFSDDDLTSRTSPSLEKWVCSIGSIAGKLETVSSRGKLSFTVYDEVNNRGVRCLIGAEWQEKARDCWDKQVVVKGEIRRDPISGRPLSIRNLTNMQLLESPDDPDAWRRAQGILNGLLPDEPAEVLIRRLRDA